MVPISTQGLQQVRRLRAMATALLLPGLLMPFSGPAMAQAYPTKSIRLVVPFAAGGGGDVLARILSEKLKTRLNQPIVVDNRPGASGIIGSDIVAKAPADGYTMLINTPNLIMTQFMTPKLPYEPLTDLVPVAEVVRAQLWLAVSTARTSARTVQEFVVETKAKGQGLFYGSVGPGSVGHLLGSGFAELAGIKAEHVGYKGGAPAALALVTGEISFAVMDYVVLKPQVDAGKVRLLATIGGKRSQNSPATPTLTEAGYPGMDMYSWAGLFVPAGTPTPVLQRLAAESRVVMADPEVVAKFVAIGYEPGSLLLDQFANMVKADNDRWAVIIRKSGVKLE
jgi:tripartite-type tricarboxylate transporter receptor subunit TctC